MYSVMLWRCGNRDSVCRVSCALVPLDGDRLAHWARAEVCGGSRSCHAGDTVSHVERYALEVWESGFSLSSVVRSCRLDGDRLAHWARAGVWRLAFLRMCWGVIRSCVGRGPPTEPFGHVHVDPTRDSVCAGCVSGFVSERALGRKYDLHYKLRHAARHWYSTVSGRCSS
jgi:hypothetical protein